MPPRGYLEQMGAQFSAYVVQGAGATRVAPRLAEPCGDTETPFSDGTPTWLAERGLCRGYGTHAVRGHGWIPSGLQAPGLPRARDFRLLRKDYVEVTLPLLGQRGLLREGRALAERLSWQCLKWWGLRTACVCLEGAEGTPGITFPKFTSALRGVMDYFSPKVSVSSLSRDRGCPHLQQMRKRIPEAVS